MSGVRVDLGEGHYYASLKVPDFYDGAILETHPGKDNWMCSSVVYFAADASDQGEVRDGKKTWKLIQAEPLTLKPSLQCAACGSHGNIVDGRWVEIPNE